MTIKQKKLLLRLINWALGKAGLPPYTRLWDHCNAFVHLMASGKNMRPLNDTECALFEDAERDVRQAWNAGIPKGRVS